MGLFDNVAATELYHLHGALVTRMGDVHLRNMDEMLGPHLKTTMEGFYVFLAGGAVRDAVIGEEPKDFDMWGRAEELKKAAEFYANLTGEPIVKNDLCWTVGEVQFIIGIEVGSPLEVLQRFDFTCCKGAYWFADRWQGMVDRDFYSDVSDRRIRWCDPVRKDHPLASVHHALRLAQKGWKISRMDFCLLMYAVFKRENMAQFKNAGDVHLAMMGFEYKEKS